VGAFSHIDRDVPSRRLFWVEIVGGAIVYCGISVQDMTGMPNRD